MGYCDDCTNKGLMPKPIDEIQLRIDAAVNNAVAKLKG